MPNFSVGEYSFSDESSSSDGEGGRAGDSSSDGEGEVIDLSGSPASSSGVRCSGCGRSSHFNCDCLPEADTPAASPPRSSADAAGQCGRCGRTGHVWCAALDGADIPTYLHGLNTRTGNEVLSDDEGALSDDEAARARYLDLVNPANERPQKRPRRESSGDGRRHRSELSSGDGQQAEPGSPSASSYYFDPPGPPTGPSYSSAGLQQQQEPTCSFCKEQGHHVSMCPEFDKPPGPPQGHSHSSAGLQQQQQPRKRKPKCRKCRKEGHNARTCPLNSAPEGVDRRAAGAQMNASAARKRKHTEGQKVAGDSSSTDNRQKEWWDRASRNKRQIQEDEALARQLAGEESQEWDQPKLADPPKEKLNIKPEPPSCSICFEAYNDDDRRQVCIYPCCHAFFCEKCMKSIKEKSEEEHEDFTCPNCREEVVGFGVLFMN